MKKLYIGLMLFVFQLYIQAAEMQNDDSYAPQAEFIETIEKLQTRSEIATMIEKVDACKQNDFNSMNTLEEYQLKTLQSMQDLQADISLFDKNAIIEDFIANPEVEYYKKTSRLPEEIKKITFELIRAKGACKKDPYSSHWQSSVKVNEQKLMDCMQSGSVQYLYPEKLIAQCQQVALLHKNMQTSYCAQRQLQDRYNIFDQGSQLLSQKQLNRQCYLEKSWKNFADKLVVQHEDHNKKMIAAHAIQLSGRKYLNRLYRDKQAQVASDYVINNALIECIQDIVCEQMQAMGREEDLKVYENLLGCKSHEIANEVIQSALVELAHEADLDAIEFERQAELAKIEREKQKARLKKARQKENKNKIKLAEQEEATLIAEQIKQNKVIEQAAQRNQYHQSLMLSGSINESNLNLAMLGYDIRHLELFDDQDNITSKESVKAFLKLFEDFLKVPFVEDVSLWDDVIIIIDKLHKKMQMNHDCLEQYIENHERFKDALWAKENDVSDVRENILKTSSKVSYDKAKLLYVQTSDQLNALVDRSNKLSNLTPLKRDFLLKISAYQENLQKLKVGISHYEEKCHQILLIQKIKHLQDTNGPLPLFKEPLPAIDSIGNLNEQDLQDCRDHLQKELSFWLRYEDEITLHDLQQSLCEMLKKLPLDEQGFDAFGSSISSDAFNCAHHKKTPSLEFKQHCFHITCKKHAMDKTLYSQELLADIVKIHHLLLEYYLKYKEQRVS